MVLAVVVATVLSFVVSAVLYSLPPVSALVARSSTPRPGLATAVVMASVVLRGLVVVLLVAGLLTAAGWSGPGTGLLLGLALGVVPVTILSGSVVHENVPVALAAVHALDWVAKLAVAGAVVGLLA